MAAKLQLGQIVITRNALNTLCDADVYAAISRHEHSDWGELDAEDRQANADALIRGFRILSAYRDRNNVKFWIITEADRSVTTVLLPEDY